MRETYQQVTIESLHRTKPSLTSRLKYFVWKMFLKKYITHPWRFAGVSDNFQLFVKISYKDKDRDGVYVGTYFKIDA